MTSSEQMFAGKKVLSVDDSRAVRAFLVSLLAETGAIVDEAGTGDEALGMHARGLAGSGRYDLILLDMVLPDIDGLSILDQMREIDKDSTIVVITGSGGVSSATAAMQHGADGYIEKHYITGQGGEPEFFYALKQAGEHRAGYVARRQLEQLRTDFYSMVTHDLRNPAGAVLGLIKLLLAGRAGALQPKQEELLKLAQTSAEKFVNLITTYLDYAKIEAGYLRVSLAEGDLTALIRSSVRQAETPASTKDLKINTDLPAAPLRAHIDAPKMEQVVDNLISNAIKYTPDGGSISVSLKKEGNNAVIRISDTGEGIPREQLGSLFTKYHRVPGQQIKGTGLGLLIVKEIAEAHGGTVSVDSDGTPGKGSTFTVRIPIKPAA